ncbi:ComEC/Rec2 family competence protein [Robinsoniella peoriensis]|uniref:ComEC/Rec2 family competence protein n=1 Tax=Robinsoniella peoriensis TaxID=180332 RepID=UPI00085CAA7E|nr:MBL fold metallo-hydrolase [Robinsoniella peoriensis]
MKYKKQIFITLFLVILCSISITGAAAGRGGRRADRRAANKNAWTVQQYGSDSDGSQSMFYTISNRKGKLIVIDGGWKQNESRVRSAIQRLGNNVDLWIITHPHPDHVGAFNAIVSNPQGIRIRKVLAPKINPAVYQKYAQEWDEYSIFEEFNGIMSGAGNLQYIKGGDTIDISGLSLQFFSSYDGRLEKTSKDICNDSSLVFKAAYNGKSMIFTGDINSRRANMLVKKYGKKLRSNYLQAPHHGNNNKRERFFKAVRPRVTFIDAPSWLRKFPAVKHNISVLKKQGSRIITYGSSRRTVKLK